jgi:hypothetical protein
MQNPGPTEKVYAQSEIGPKEIHCSEVRETDAFCELELCSPREVSRNGRAIDMVNCIFRAAEILNMLSLGRNRITDICQELGLSKGTVHRLLKTLEQCGFVFLDPITHQYYLGHLIIKLSSNPDITHQNLIVCAYDEMKMLRDKSGETTALFIPIGNRRGDRFQPRH